MTLNQLFDLPVPQFHLIKLLQELNEVIIDIEGKNNWNSCKCRPSSFIFLRLLLEGQQ